jgi:hypothetical protein
MSILPTMRVKRDGPKGYRIINTADFDPAVHEPLNQPWNHPAPSHSVDGMTDDELRAHVETVTGTKPHHRAGRAKLLEMLDGAE